MGVIDIIIIALLGLMLIIGISKGFVKQIFSLISWAAAIIVPLLFYSPVTKLIAGDVDPIPFSTTAIVFVAMFLITFVVVRIIGSIFGKNIHKSPLGFIDRLLGAAWGITRALLIISIVFITMEWAATLPLIGVPITNLINTQLTSETGVGLAKYLYENNLLLKLMEVLNLSQISLELL
jgi:membrane protein required for colicin V production